MTQNLTVKPTTWETLPTVQFLQVIAALENCKATGRTAMLIGDTGYGKTHTIEKFISKHREHTYMIKVGYTFKLPDIINDLCDMLHIELEPIRGSRVQGNSMRLRVQRITNALIEIKKNGGNPLLIFDESENMRIEVLKALKELYDAIEYHTAIVLIGTDQLLVNMRNDKNKNRQSLPQLYSRFKMGKVIIPPINKERDFKPFFDKYITNKTVRQYLLNRCDTYRDLRNAIMPLIEESERLAMPIDEKLYFLVHENLAA